MGRRRSPHFARYDRSSSTGAKFSCTGTIGVQLEIDIPSPFNRPERSAQSQ